VYASDPISIKPTIIPFNLFMLRLIGNNPKFLSFLKKLCKNMVLAIVERPLRHCALPPLNGIKTPYDQDANKGAIMRSLYLFFTALLILCSSNAYAQVDIAAARGRLYNDATSTESLLGKDGADGDIDLVLQAVEVFDLADKNPDYNTAGKDLDRCYLWLYKLASDNKVLENAEYAEELQTLSAKTTDLQNKLEAKRAPEYIATGNENLKDVLKKGKLGANEFEKLFIHNENGIAVKVRNAFYKDQSNPVKILEYLVVEKIRQKYSEVANGTSKEAKSTIALIRYNGFFVPTSGIKEAWDAGLELVKTKADLVKDIYVEEYSKINKIKDIEIEVK
jgi:hypothetical protein